MKKKLLFALLGVGAGVAAYVFSKKTKEEDKDANVPKTRAVVVTFIDSVTDTEVSTFCKLFDAEINNSFKEVHEYRLVFNKPLTESEFEDVVSDMFDAPIVEDVRIIEAPYRGNTEE